MRKKFICSKCGHIFPQWYGRCPSCDEYSSIKVYENINKPNESHISITKKSVTDINIDTQIRIRTGEKPIDAVFGGGIVPGSLVLIAGAPGVGKSTILLQIARFIAEKGKVIYFSAEESLGQIKLRADRLKINEEALFISDSRDTDAIASNISGDKPTAAIIDSIQTVSSRNIAGITGSVNQLRYSTEKFLEVAKDNNIPIIIVGHITKGGLIAGPKLLEHMVDTVLLVEETGEYKLLRATKNRFGTIDQTAIMQMGENGLTVLENPEGIFLGDKINASGIVRSVTIKGSQPLAVEIESLVSPYGIGKSRAIGFDVNRAIMLSAIIEKRLNIKISEHDTYLNVTGGVSIDEIGVDLAVCAAIISSIKNKPLNLNYAFIGEVGLAGEIRPVQSIERRINAALRLGFTDLVLPNISITSKVALHKIRFLNDLIGYI